MGEMAEMMIDGTLCAMCGVILDGDTPEYPRACSDKCKRDYPGDIEVCQDEFDPEKHGWKKAGED